MKIIISKVCVTSIAVTGHEILGPVSGVMLSHTQVTGLVLHQHPS